MPGEKNVAPAGALATVRVQLAKSPVSLIVSLAVVLAICLVATPKYALTTDDCVQALYVSGRYLGSGASLLMPYSLAPFSMPIGLLYQVLPMVPWYPLALMALVVASFAVALRQAASSELSDPLAAICLAVTLALEVICTMYFTFTVIAFLAVAAGLMLLLRHAAFERAVGPRPSDVGGCLLVLLGYSLRPESGLATFAVFAPFAVWVLVRNRNLGSILRGAAAVACVAVAIVAGHVAYATTPGWQDFESYLDAGRGALDYPDLPTEQVTAAFPELSENDVDILYNWMFIDDGVFNTAFFEELGQVGDHFSPAYLIGSLGAKTTWLLLALVALLGGLAWVFSADVGRRRDVRALALGIVVMALAEALMLIMRERVRLHVVLPLFAVTFFALVTCALAPRAEQAGAGSHFRAPTAATCGLLRGRSAVVVPAATCVLALLVCAGFWWTQIRPARAQSDSPTFDAAQAYLADNPDELVVFIRTHSTMYTGFDVFSFDGWDYPDNALTVGGWESHTGPWAEFLERWSLTREATLTELVDRPDAVAVVAGDRIDMVVTYLSEHLGRPVEAQLVETLGPGLVDTSTDISVYRFVSA